MIRRIVFLTAFTLFCKVSLVFSQNPLSEAIRSLDPDVSDVDQLMDIVMNEDYRGYINQADRKGVTPIQDVIYFIIDAAYTFDDEDFQKYGKIIAYMESNGADLNSSHKKGASTPFQSAVEYFLEEGDWQDENELDALGILLVHGADPYFKTKSKYASPIERLFEEGADPIIINWISHGLDLNYEGRFEDDMSAFMMAVWLEKTYLANLMISEGADIDQRMDENVTSALDLAMRAGSFEMSQLLIDRGLDIHAKCPVCAHESFLHRAAMYNDHQVARLLLEHGLDVNIRDDNEETPLYWALYYGNSETAKLYIENGADVNAVNNEGVSIWEIASDKNKKDTQLLNMLKARGAK